MRYFFNNRLIVISGYVKVDTNVNHGTVFKCVLFWLYRISFFYRYASALNGWQTLYRSILKLISRIEACKMSWCQDIEDASILEGSH